MEKRKDEIKLYKVDPLYIKALRDESKGGDSRAYKEDKTQRPYVGVVTVCNGQKYCIPLTSNKEKFSKMTGKIDISLIVIQGKIKGAVEFSRMIPIEDGQLKKLNMDFRKHDKPFRRAAIQERIDTLNWCKEHSEEIRNKANVLYETYISGKEFKRRKECLNFPQLEKICQEYNKTQAHQHKPKDKDFSNGRNIKKADKGNKKNFNINKMSIIWKMI